GADRASSAPPPPLGRWIPIYGRGARSAGTSGSGRRRTPIGDRSGFAQVRRSRLSGWRDQERDRIGCGDRPGGDQGNREPPLAHYPHLTILLPEALWSTARANAVRARNAEQRHSRALEEGGATAALQDCELAEVRRDAAAKHVEIVAALQQRDDASVGVLPRDLPDEGRDPGVVGFEQAQKRHPVVAMRVEAGGDEEHLRLEPLQRREPLLLDGFAELAAPRACGERHVHHPLRAALDSTAGIEGVLERRDHQDPTVLVEHLFGAVAVVHVEI